MKRAALIAALALVIAAGAIGWRFTWFRVFNVGVTVNGAQVPGAVVYRNHRGSFFVNLNLASTCSYVVDGPNHWVGVPGKEPLLYTRLCFVVAGDPWLCVNMRSSKLENRDPKLEISAGSISFVDYEHQVVRLDWR